MTAEVRVSRKAQDFHIGQAVQMTELAVRSGVTQGRAKSRNGTVAGLGRSPLQIWVLRDGLKHPDGYHVDFWEPADEADTVSNHLGFTPAFVAALTAALNKRAPELHPPFTRLDVQLLLQRAAKAGGGPHREGSPNE